MKILITGGSASGKSAHAERLLCAYSTGLRVYVATMEPFGKEAQERIAKHRLQRAGKGFLTKECYRALSRLTLPAGTDGVLLEDLGNLLAGEMFAQDATQAEASVWEGIHALASQCNTLVVVSNEIFTDGGTYPAETIQYMQMLGRLHQKLTANFDWVAESVCGILVPVKGEAPQ